MTLPPSDALVGTIGLMPDTAGDSAELGYWLSPDVWGKGLLTEAGSAVVSFAFRQIGLSRLTSGHAVDNPASGRVLRKLGFVEAGRRPQPCLATGEVVASLRMELVRVSDDGASAGTARQSRSTAQS